MSCRSRSIPSHVGPVGNGWVTGGVPLGPARIPRLRQHVHSLHKAQRTTRPTKPHQRRGFVFHCRTRKHVSQCMWLFCLSPELIPVVLFGQTAFNLLRDHPQVYADRVGIIGLSFGVYLTFSIAIESDVKVRQRDQCLFLGQQLHHYTANTRYMK